MTVLYDSRSFLGVAFALKGSVFPHIIPRSLVRPVSWADTVRALRLTCRSQLVASVGALAAWLNDTHRLRYTTDEFITYTGAIVAFLVVFRINAAYTLYDRGASVVSSLSSASRCIVIQISSAVAGRSGLAVATRSHVRRLVLLVVLLAFKHVRKDEDINPLREAGLLTEEEFEQMDNMRTTVAAEWLLSAVYSLQHQDLISPYAVKSVSKQVAVLIGDVQTASRIVYLNLPLPYAQVVRVCVLFYVLGVPFALAKDLAWLTPAACFIMALLVFAVEETSVELEDPFGCDVNDFLLEDIFVSLSAETALLVSSVNRVMEPHYTGATGTLFTKRHAQFDEAQHRSLIAALGGVEGVEEPIPSAGLESEGRGTSRSTDGGTTGTPTPAGLFKTYSVLTRKQSSFGGVLVHSRRQDRAGSGAAQDGARGEGARLGVGAGVAPVSVRWSGAGVAASGSGNGGGGGGRSSGVRPLPPTASAVATSDDLRTHLLAGHRGDGGRTDVAGEAKNDEDSDSREGEAGCDGVVALHDDHSVHAHL